MDATPTTALLVRGKGMRPPTGVLDTHAIPFHMGGTIDRPPFFFPPTLFAKGGKQMRGAACSTPPFSFFTVPIAYLSATMQYE